MKKTLLLLTFFIMGSFNVYAQPANDPYMAKIQKEADKITQPCYKKHLSNASTMPNMDLQEATLDYNKCLKNAIVTQIKNNFKEPFASKMIAGISQIENGTYLFYSNMYESTDTGILGHMQDKMAVSKQLEDAAYALVFFYKDYK